MRNFRIFVGKRKISYMVKQHLKDSIFIFSHFRTEYLNPEDEPCLCVCLSVCASVCPDEYFPQFSSDFDENALK